MNRKQIEHNLAMAHFNGDRSEINRIYIDLVNTKYRLSKWFDRFLDMFDEQLDQAKQSDPLRRIYNHKFEKYSEVQRTMKTAEYFMKKG